ncbi:hypothetical protein LB506_001122 [Fusarium annulatum]|nr:hypothetical protein LB506_001122 [Fusarium annulatum]
MRSLYEPHIYVSIMSNISTEQIVTILSTIPGLLISCLSASFAYLALQRSHVTPSNLISHTSVQFSRTATCSPCTKLLLISYFRAKIYPSCHLCGPPEYKWTRAQRV